MRPALTVLALFAAFGLAHAGPIAVNSTPVASFQNLSSNSQFGPLAWRGGLSLESSDADFGGLSGLVLDQDCQRLTAVSDAGRWFTATLAYDGEGRLSGLDDARLGPMLDGRGKAPRYKRQADAEAIAALGQGKYLVGFENDVRVTFYDLSKGGLKARAQLVKSPKAITEGPPNGEMESLGLLSTGPYKGNYIVISEKNRDAQDNIRGWIWKSWKTVPFAVQRLEDYDITDLALLPDGDVLTLERSFSSTSLPGMAIRRFHSSAIAAGAIVKPDTVFAGRVPFYNIDNMEGLALCQRHGEVRITLVSDNNFNTALQRTLLLQFSFNAAVKP